MTRSAPRAALLVLAGAVLAALAIGPALAAAAPAPRPGCNWQRHSKSVVRHLRQDGRSRRLKRIKHWWTCNPQPTILTPGPALPVQPLSETTPAGEPGPEVGHLGVKSVEYSYTLSRPEVDAGEVIVELNNQGEDPHNLVLEHEGSADPSLEIPATPAVSQASAHFTLSPGTYHLYCSLYSHESKGMVATLIVGSG